MEHAVPILSDGLRSLAALAAVLGLVVLLVWGLRRTGLIRTAAGSGRLRIEAAMALDGRTRLVLVRCDERQHLLAVGPGGVSVIESRTVAAPATPSATEGDG